MKTYIVLLIIISSLASQTAEIFQDLSSASSIQSAMGNTMIANSVNVFSGNSNPALLNELTSAMTFQFSTGFRNFTEERKFPAYSAFDSQIGNEIYATSDFNQFKYNLGLSKSFVLDNLPVTVSISRQMIMTNDYFYKENVRSRESGNQNLLAFQIIEQTGDFYENNLAFATKVNRFSLGFSLSMITAEDYKYRREVRLTEDADSDLVDELLAKDQELIYSYKQENKPFRYRFGALVPVLENLTLGGSVVSAYDIEYSLTATKITTHMPYQSAFGLEYFAGNKLRSKFTFDFRFIAWSDYKFNEGNANIFDDIYSYHFGFEHLVDGYPLRLGMQFNNSKIDKSIQTTRFSLGTSLKLNFFQIDLATDYSYASFSEKDLFPEGIYINRGNPFSERNSLDDIEQSYLNFSITISYLFGDK
jgi:hypothetical protein